MGGPGALVILGQETNANDRLEIDGLLDSIGSGPPAEDRWPDIWIVTTKSIGGSYKGEGRPFGIEWVIGEEYPGEDEDSPSWRSDVFRAFGITPHYQIGIDAGCNQKEDHRILGELSLYLARRFNGLIDFCGALMPPVTLTGRENAIQFLMKFEHANWEDLCESARLFFRTFPGRLLEFPYQTAYGTTWVNHVCDAEFMTAWLQHPHFYMVK